MSTKALIHNVLALLGAIICFVTGWFWVYYINLFTALPIFLLGLFATSKAKNAMPGNNFSKLNTILLWLSVVFSLIFLFIFLSRG